MTKWVSTAVVLAIHDEQIAEHGGLGGVRDLNTLESVLARPKNRAAYSTSDLAALAAAYAYGIATTQSFVEGNKRTSAVVASLFLALNGAELTASEAEIVQIWSELGAGNLSEDALTDWFRERMTKISAAARRRRRSRTGRARR